MPTNPAINNKKWSKPLSFLSSLTMTQTTPSDKMSRNNTTIEMKSGKKRHFSSAEQIATVICDGSFIVRTLVRRAVSVLLLSKILSVLAPALL